MIELTFLKELMSIRQVNQKIRCLSRLAFLGKRFKFQSDVCNGCHDVLMMPTNLSNFAILNIHGDDYWCVECIDFMYWVYVSISGICRNLAEILHKLYSKYRKKWKIIKHKNILSHIKLHNEIFAIGDIKIEKDTFYQHKRHIFQKM